MARVLIADDNATIRDLMKFYIEHSGHIVCGEAEDGLQAVECAKHSQPDLILLDMAMPVMNGIEAASVLKCTVPATPIILFTLHEDSINRNLAATMGVDLVVDKIEGIPKLGESIKSLLTRAVKAAHLPAPTEGSSPKLSSDPAITSDPRKKLH